MQRFPEWLGDPTPIVRDTIRWGHDPSVTVSQNVAWMVAIWAMAGVALVGYELWVFARDVSEAWRTHREERRIIAKARATMIRIPRQSTESRQEPRQDPRQASRHLW